MSSSSLPTYFEYSWAILSSIGIANVLFGLTVVGITNLSQISLLPIIVSAAGAIANGLCYCAFYADYPKTPTAAASAIADITWLVRSITLLEEYRSVCLLRITDSRSRLDLLQLLHPRPRATKSPPNHLHVPILGVRRRRHSPQMFDCSHKSEIHPRHLVKPPNDHRSPPCRIFLPDSTH
jgi:hypothetical protein